METAKIFTNGGSQAVRLPRDCRFEASEVFAKRIGNAVILMPKDDKPWATMLMGLELFSEDCLSDGAEDLPPEEREGL
ncbi:MAG: AbrB/MazE/SpoVT family DNA-binding domain-containing protein [Clostridia bacterium]|nr:AbrB/MazE/SpoVT family DNA-binding domain-containing protein [Clostridia bacterium]